MIRSKLAEQLGKRKMHIRDLERESSVSYHTLWALYHEKTKMVSFNTIDEICRNLQCQVGDLFEYVEEEPEMTKSKKR